MWASPSEEVITRIFFRSSALFLGRESRFTSASRLESQKNLSRNFAPDFADTTLGRVDKSLHVATRGREEGQMLEAKGRLGSFGWILWWGRSSNPVTRQKNAGRINNAELV